MEHPYLSLVKFFELIGFGHFAHAYPHVIYTWFVMILLIVLGAIASKGVTMIPNKMQNVFEALISGAENFMVEQTGEEGRWFFPILGTAFFYILTCNLIGLIPTFYPPTASISTTVSCAVVIFIVTHFIGFKYHGVKYYHHFTGPIWWLIPIIFPIELISHAARVLSLSMRLFGNMMGHETVLTIFFALAGLFIVPTVLLMAMGIFVAFVQAFIFCLLSTIYFKLSMEHAH